ncbi:hypothetical protein P1P75_32235 [Streptomyces sp. ID05-39B]|uniref:hypothetical protein n=1 Tax=Streptomyces sp. ID05-39B TaxID=3028664 RepID=UPI0029B97600|nr:hypothetical protein [Streptomyces sp. ID05-39B]MDX3530951.1 hypothetical protein [Streptomyces sp. ID05-39B]
MENEQMLHALIEKLIEKTKEGRINWTDQESVETRELGSRSFASFTLSLTRGTISIWSTDGDDLHPYVFQIRGDRGQVVEQIETSRILATEDREYTQIENSIRVLYDLARRNALNTDSVLRQILDDLNGK